MSYCRWSTDDFLCDLYVYAHVGGYWSINVASSKRKGLEEILPPKVELSSPPTKEEISRALERQRKVHDLLDECELVPIGKKYDGEAFQAPTPRACAEKLKELKDLGYRFPDSVISDLLEEDRERTEMKNIDEV